MSTLEIYNSQIYLSQWIIHILVELSGISWKLTLIIYKFILVLHCISIDHVYNLVSASFVDYFWAKLSKMENILTNAIFRTISIYSVSPKAWHFGTRLYTTKFNHVMWLLSSKHFVMEKEVERCPSQDWNICILLQ